MPLFPCPSRIDWMASFFQIRSPKGEADFISPLVRRPTGQDHLPDSSFGHWKRLGVLATPRLNDPVPQMLRR